MALTALEERVCKEVARRREDLLADLKLHVGIPTGGNHRAGLEETRERLTSRLAGLGAAVEVAPGEPRPDWLYGIGDGGAWEWVPPTAVCRRDAGVGGEWGGRVIVLSGHMDTVHDPEGAFNQLTIAPDGKTATGPGCVDMKGGLVIAVGALEALEACGVRVAWSFILNSDEETGSYCSEGAIRAEAARVLREWERAGGKAGHEPVGLVFEPATPPPQSGLVIERAGSGQFVFEARGKSAHVGRDFGSGVSAVTALARCIVDAAGLTDLERGMICNVGPLEGGIATNVVAERARAWGNVRFRDQGQGEELARRLAEIAAGHSVGGATVEAKVSLVRAAKPVTEGTMRLAEVARGVSEDLGRELPFAKTAGVCDGNILQGAGIACIDTLGVRGGGLHTEREWIELDSLVERCQMAALVMMRLAGGTGH